MCYCLISYTTVVQPPLGQSPLFSRCRPLSGQSLPPLGRYSTVTLCSLLLFGQSPLFDHCPANHRCHSTVIRPLSNHCSAILHYLAILQPLFSHHSAAIRLLFSSCLANRRHCLAAGEGWRRLRKGDLVGDRSHRQRGRNQEESITQRNTKEDIERINDKELQRISTCTY